MSDIVKFIVKHQGDKLPIRGSFESVGYDVYCPETILLPPLKVTKISLGFSMALPMHLWCQIMDRSSMGCKGIHVFGGVIDPDYSGEIGLVLYNSNNTPHEINKDDRIAQLVFHERISPYIQSEINEGGMLGLVQNENIIKRHRGEGGFGSTGV